jgi:hypothetical protein
MTKQYLLARDVIRLLTKEAFPNDKEKQRQVRRLIRKHGLFIDDAKALPSVTPLFQFCANFLESKGFYVYLDIETNGGKVTCITFAVGETGRLLKKLDSQIFALKILLKLIQDYPQAFPPELVSLERELSSCTRDMVWFILYGLLPTYMGNKKRELKQMCEEGWRLSRIADKCLEKFGDWQKYAGLALL